MLHLTRSLIALLIAAPASAQDVPPAQFFHGSYDIVGRWETSDGRALEMLSGRAVMDARSGLSTRLCGLGDGEIAVTNEYEGGLELSGEVGDGEIGCAIHITGGNYPFLACRYSDAKRQARFVLWPRLDDFENVDFDCPK